jgi:hypothetical protein
MHSVAEYDEFKRVDGQQVGFAIASTSTKDETAAKIKGFDVRYCCCAILLIFFADRGQTQVGQCIW